MNNNIAVQNNTNNYSKEQVDLIKRTVAPKASDDELKMFLHLAKTYQLDPFAKQIWFIKYNPNDAPKIFTSRDGYLDIAHRSGQFDGMESYTIDDEEGNPQKAVCIVYRKDMTHPFKAEIKVKEYNTKKSVWASHPSAMAIKVAEVFALKRAFSISGLLTKEEFDIEEPIVSPPAPITAIEPEIITPRTETRTETQQKIIYKLLSDLNIPMAEAKNKIKGIIGEYTEPLNRDQAEIVITTLSERVANLTSKKEKVAENNAQTPFQIKAIKQLLEDLKIPAGDRIAKICSILESKIEIDEMTQEQANIVIEALKKDYRDKQDRIKAQSGDVIPQDSGFDVN